MYNTGGFSVLISWQLQVLSIFQPAISEEFVNTQVMQHFCHWSLTIFSIFVAELWLSWNTLKIPPPTFQQTLTLPWQIEAKTSLPRCFHFHEYQEYFLKIKQRANQPKKKKIIYRNISSAMEHAKKLKSCWRHISLFPFKTSTLNGDSLAWKYLFLNLFPTCDTRWFLAVLLLERCCELF